MGSLEDRLRRLEERIPDPDKSSASGGPDRGLLRLFRAMENLQLAADGLEPLPEIPYLPGERRRDAERFLAETLPQMRAELGGQAEEARFVLDRMEDQARATLAELDDLEASLETEGEEA